MSNLVIHDSINKIDASQWNQLNDKGNPFVSHEFFDALEKGQCLKDQSGWHPLYFLYEVDELKCALVTFIKTDSYGEFIFDWDWARAYQQHGLNYYPKLTLAIPYSPISAPKVLGDVQIAEEKLIPALWSFYQKENLSGLHFLFTSEQEGKVLSEYKMWERDSYQFHWYRNSCNDFEDYLKTLSKNRRKTIKRERRDIAAKTALSFEVLTQQDLTEEYLNFFYDCYLRTIDKKWSQAYLTKDFFKEIFTNLQDKVYLIVAKETDKAGTVFPIACSLYLASKDTLFGRYWGSVKDIPFLHFELCIYQGIELALSLDLKKFEAGAQGEHKRLRGFKPIITKSWHHLKHPQFNEAVGDFIKRESVAINDWFKD